jgi:hypothetical protein
MNIGGAKHADAVVAGCEKAHRVVENHVSDKIVMMHTEDDSAEAYGQFYKKLLG